MSKYLWFYLEFNMRENRVVIMTVRGNGRVGMIAMNDLMLGSYICK